MALDTETAPTVTTAEVPPPSEPAQGEAEHVGLLIVHGIGEQKRFQTAQFMARSLAGTLAADKPHPQFTLIERINPQEITQPPPFCPSNDLTKSPYEIRIKGGADTRDIHIHIYEAWWADLGAPSSLVDQIKFWFWGLGQWGVNIDRVSDPSKRANNTDKLMVGPLFPSQNKPGDDLPVLTIISIRLQLFIGACLTLCTLLSWLLVKRIGGWFSPLIGSSSILTQYIGDVRTYTQAPGLGGGNLIDVGQPWRATIRRRMVQEMIAMGERKFDRWYVMAHSLGSVVAFNALNEPEWSLPNYLDQEHVVRLRRTRFWTNSPYIPAPQHNFQPNLSNMMPRRPVWLGDTEGVSRTEVFGRFRGLVTFGSPLDKFAALWPRIVGINKQTGVFPKEADWINLVEATDPVAGQLDAFSKSPYAWPVGGPKNYQTRVSPVFLLSHIGYFLPRKYQPQSDTLCLLKELAPTNGEPPGLRKALEPVETVYDSNWLRRLGAKLQVLGLGSILFSATAALAMLAELLLSAMMSKAPTWLANIWTWLIKTVSYFLGSGFGTALLLVVVFVVLIVFLAGLVRRAEKSWRP